MDKKVWIIGGVIILGGATAYILLNKKAAAAQTMVPSSGAGATGIPAGATGAITPQGGATDSTPGVLPGGTTLYDNAGQVITIPPPAVIPASGALSVGQGGKNTQGIGAGLNLNTNPNTSPLTITAGTIVPTQTDPVSGITTPIPAGAIGTIGSSTGVPSGITGSIGQGTPAPSGGGTSALGGQSLGLGLTPSAPTNTNPDPYATGNNAPYAQAPVPVSEPVFQPAGPLPTGISEAEATALLLDPSTASQVVAAPNNAGNTIFNFVPGPGFGVKL